MIHLYGALIRRSYGESKSKKSVPYMKQILVKITVKLLLERDSFYRLVAFLIILQR